ncbi:MAG TPA: glycosyl hydrolase family 65 protein, partial [Planctomycetota bacterium]|nr:glycosyl hydrolase family 65 protein [Planctomycetota bacterium]
SQYILGLKPTHSGLRIDPCVPKTWKKWEVKRKFRGATLNIHVKNPDGVQKGVVRVTVDGEEIDGNVVPVQPEGTVHEVEVLMG